MQPAASVAHWFCLIGLSFGLLVAKHFSALPSGTYLLATTWFEDLLKAEFMAVIHSPSWVELKNEDFALGKGEGVCDKLPH